MAGGERREQKGGGVEGSGEGIVARGAKTGKNGEVEEKSWE